MFSVNILGTGISPGVASSAVKHSGSHTSCGNPEGTVEENSKMLQVQMKLIIWSKCIVLSNFSFQFCVICYVYNTKFNLLLVKFKDPCDTIEPQQPISRRKVKFSFMHQVTQYLILFVTVHELFWLDIFHNPIKYITKYYIVILNKS